jgi:pilus assembly protein Flp/PilA
MMNKLRALFTEEEGQGMTEYGLILGSIAVLVIVVVGLLGTEIKAFFADILPELPTFQ